MWYIFFEYFWINFPWKITQVALSRYVYKIIPYISPIRINYYFIDSTYLTYLLLRADIYRRRSSRADFIHFYLDSYTILNQVFFLAIRCREQTWKEENRRERASERERRMKERKWMEETEIERGIACTLLV